MGIMVGIINLRNFSVHRPGCGPLEWGPHWPLSAHHAKHQVDVVQPVPWVTTSATCTQKRGLWREPLGKLKLENNTSVIWKSKYKRIVRTTLKLQ